MGLFSSVCCDSCDKSLPFFYTTIDDMIKTATKWGWKVNDDGEAICDECYKKRTSECLNEP